jgi:hypothetical protein
MKLEPIVNPHAKSGQGVQKKTKQEEKDELIEKTKKSTIDKYGVRFINVKPLWLSIKFLTCIK